MNEDDVRLFLHCKDCSEELPFGKSMKNWARLNVGLTTDGTLLLWCVRHKKPCGVFELADHEKKKLAHLTCSVCPED